MKPAQIVYALDAVLGVISIAGAALYGASYASGNVWLESVKIFVPFALLWLLFCYGAYRGLTSSNLLLRLVFWVHVVGNLFAFPVGTAIAVACVWLWRESKKQNVDPDLRGAP